jgi:NodT family efflux transporter outer membrane factor (OMF) lipoprotein
MTVTNTPRLQRIVAFSAFLALASCAVGPNFKKPEGPDATEYRAEGSKETAATKGVLGGEAQHFVKNVDIQGDWWEVFHSKALNDLVERSLKNNPSIKAGQAALAVARHNVLSQEGAFFPQIGALFSATRAATSQQLSPVTAATEFYYSLYTPQLNVSYTPDVFGLNRRTVESLKAQEEQQRYALAATHITLSANVVSAAIQEASLRGQVAATQQLIDLNTKALDILKTQFSKGYASRVDLAAQESQLAQVQATLPPLLKQLGQQRDLLAALAGVIPSQGPAEKFDLADLHLPRELPLTLPARLVEQRPDVKQAEENLHAASALIGVSIANMLPQFTLSANGGSSALEIGQLFTPGLQFWTIAGAAAQPIFEGGALYQKNRGAVAAYRQAGAQYRGAVITACQNVADTLVALDQDAKGLHAAAEAEHAAKVTLDLVTKQKQIGYASYLQLLSAEQTYQQAVINLVQAQANRYADTAALFQALGGGWWHRPDASSNDEQLKKATAAEGRAAGKSS